MGHAEQGATHAGLALPQGLKRHSGGRSPVSGDAGGPEAGACKEGGSCKEAGGREEGAAEEEQGGVLGRGAEGEIAQ